jgi:hypothetical protein
MPAREVDVHGISGRDAGLTAATSAFERADDPSRSEAGFWRPARSGLSMNCTILDNLASAGLPILSEIA